MKSNSRIILVMIVLALSSIQLAYASVEIHKGSYYRKGGYADPSGGSNDTIRTVVAAGYHITPNVMATLKKNDGEVIATGLCTRGEGSEIPEPGIGLVDFYEYEFTH